MKLKKRILSLLLCGAMLFSLCSQSVLAEENGQAGGVTIGTSGLCEHHPEHNADCGYTEGTAGTPCVHEHTVDCYEEVTNCVHEHDEDCYPEESVSGNEATPSGAQKREPENCPHICDEESGCITKELNCQHEHDDECGYSPATAGTPCGYVCELCGSEDSEKLATPSNAEAVTVASVQAMIDGLPNAEEITEDNAEEVKAQLEAIDEAKEKLSDEEIDELDMTRYAEAAAALGALAAPMLLANDSPDEQFSLKPGDTYYFDLSGANIPGTANGSLPDNTLHYVPFTYAGTVDAYKLTSEMETTEEYAQQNKYPHSLFVADYAVTHTISWGGLNDKGLIFGKNYASGGVDYTLRAPSVGSISTGSGDSQRGVPQSNEWDTMLNKNSGYIQNWNKMYSWGQDISSAAESFRAYRGYNSARFWYYTSSSFRNVYLGFRPVLEVLNPGTLGSDGLKVVTLDLGGGKLGNSSEDIQIIVKTGSEFTAPASGGLTRPDGDAGSFFMWLGSNGKFYAPGDSVPAEVTKLTAQWTAPTYAVTLNTNGGTINNGNVTEYIYGVGATLPAADDMTYTGHTFKGWYDNEGLTGDPVTAIGGTEMGNKEYWAKWEINQYTITFDTAGGSAIAPITQDYGTAITAPADPTREGYTFAGWDTAIPATMPAHNMTITAQWTVNQYTITYDLDGGTAEGNPDTYTVETDAFTLKNPTRPGYTFTGWSGTGLTGEDNLTVTIPKGSTGNRSYTAHWSLNTYSITYDLNGGTASGNPTSYTVESATITLNQPTKTGYTFTGWSGTDLTGEDNLTVTIPAGSTGDRSYTAHWSLNTYSITYDLNGGTVSGNPDFYTVESAAITLNPPTRTGYTFIGWSGTDLSGSDNLTVTIPTGSIVNRSYTAHWSLNTYSITYDLDGGTAFGNPDSYTVESAAITLNEPTKAGYVFNGWSGTDLVGEDNLTVTIPAGSIGDRRYTAHWEFDPTIIAALNPTPNADFLDVSRVDWFYYDVRYVCENGLMNGTSRNRFSPYGTATHRPCPVTRCPPCAGPAAQASCKAQTASSTPPASPPAPNSQPCCTDI